MRNSAPIAASNSQGEVSFWHIPEGPIPAGDDGLVIYIGLYQSAPELLQRPIVEPFMMSGEQVLFPRNQFAMLSEMAHIGCLRN
jgi:hypothetical protein